MTAAIKRPSVGEGLLHGAPAIAAHLGMTTSAVYALVREADNGFPAFKVGGKLRARPQSLDHWLLSLERQAVEEGRAS